jgi:hypothetical protein
MASAIISDDFEPADLLAAVEHQLQGADPGCKCKKTEPVEPAAGAFFALLHEGDQSDDRENTHWQIDEKYPVPAVVVGEPGAERGSHDRAEHHADAPDCHGRAALLGRIGIEHDGLRERHKRRAECALEKTETDHLRDIGREAAED